MKKLSFLLFVFCSFALESKANWTRFYESWGDKDKDEILSCSPLLRLEIRRYEKGNQHYFDIEVYRMEGNNRWEVFNKKDQNLPGHNPISEEIHLGKKYNNKIALVTLDSQSNILDIGGLSLNHNFDIVTNMRLRFLDSLVSNKQVRVFSEYEVNNPERIQGSPFIVMDDRSLLKKTLKDHIEKNPQLLNSSKNKDIVVFLGNTGAGKSTLMNYLNNKKLKVDDEDNIVLSNPSDSSAMRIGTGARSETLLPRFVKINSLRMYDFPGFGDTRGTSVSLVNACFIKHILETAKTVRLIFIAGYNEATAVRGEHIKKLSHTAENLLPGNQIEECSALIITQSLADKKEKLIQILRKKTDHGVVDRWIDQGKLAKMSFPLNRQINQDDRQDILRVIEETPSKKLPNVNIQAIYDSSNLDYLRKTYFEEMQEVFVNLREENFKGGDLSSLSIKALTKMKKSFERSRFFTSLEEKLQQSALITLLRPISDHLYTETWNSKQKELILDLRTIEDMIEEEITKRKRNLLVSPQEYAKKLNRITDISELLKKSQVSLPEKKSWTKEVLHEICNRNYSLIRKWLNNTLSKKYSKLEESDKTYLIPEVCGKDGAWEFYKTPILHELVFEKREDEQRGYNYITFIKRPLVAKTTPFKKEVVFKYTRLTEKQESALEADSGYLRLCEQEKELDRQLEDCEHKYSKKRKDKEKNKEKRETNASNTHSSDISQADRASKSFKMEPFLYCGKTEQRRVETYDHEKYSSLCEKARNKWEESNKTLTSWYNEEILKIERNEEDDKEKIRTAIKSIQLQKESYKNKKYPEKTIAYRKTKQINDIMEEIIKPNFNRKTFKKAIEYKTPNATKDDNLERKFSNKKRKRSSSEKKRGDSKRGNPKRKKQDTPQQG